MRQKGQPPARGWTRLRRSLSPGLCWTVAALLALAAPAEAQSGSVIGTVVSSGSLRPLSGAQVFAAGTDRGTVTDANGRFALTGLTGAQVTVNVVMLGYRDASVTVAVGTSDLRIELAESALALDQIVVTGQVGGTQRRAVGNSVASVNAAEAVEIAPINSVQELINGRAPGVVIMPGTGMVGSGSVVRVRGTSTFSLSGDPLIYVDGVRVLNETGSGISIQAFGSGVASRLNDFSEDDIESIEILKGPAAATLYGTEASRGVINIITKKGAPGGTRYTLSTSQGANWFMNPEGRMPVNYWRGPDGEVQSLNITQRESDAGRPIFRTGRVQEYSASVSGGAESLRYYLGFDMEDAEGAERNNWKEQVSTRANLQILPHENVDISVSVGYVQNDMQMSCEGGCGGAMWGAVFSNPRFLGENCTATSPYGCGFTRGFQSAPPERYYVFDATQGIDRLTGSVTANWKTFPWLTQRLTVGTDFTAEQNEEYQPRISPAADTMLYFLGPTTSLGYKYQTRRTHYNNTFDYAATVNTSLSESISSATSFGLQYYQKRIEFIGVQGNEFAAPGLETVGTTARKTYTDDDYLDNNTLGVYAQQQFGLNSRLFVTAAARIDNNSAFGSDLDWVVYPKASLSWVLNEEPAIGERLPDFIDAFKLRLAYGQSGQQPLSFSALRTYAAITGPFDTPAVTPSTVGNSELGPERGHEIEAGFDAGLWDDRVGLEFTYYNKRTTDAILLRPSAPSSGFTASRYVNAGEIVNQGVEALLRMQLMQRDNFAWDATLTAATNGAKVTKLVGGDTTIVLGSTQHRVGYAPRSWFRERVVSADYDPETNTVSNVMCDDGSGGVVACYNEAGQVVAPRIYLGRTTPAFEGSVSTSLRFFDALTFYALVDVKTGYRKYDNNLRARCQVFSLCLENMYPERYDPARIAMVRSNGTLSSFVINDASFAKLREVSLQYNVPQSIMSRMGARAGSINVAARNLHTWTGYTGLDPENQFLEGGNVGLEQSNLPQLATFVTTFRVSF
ncbi:MAG TPA: SusC/RagA family TonB-linked outer membrane protein [Longimicrobiales bacterium]|nr:SusC/RagA family TonB-linked outer membrane protein [Longimicrobiales bacterium]